MLNRYTSNIDFDLYRNAADKLGIRFIPLLNDTEPLGYFSLGGKRLYIQRNKLGVNNSISTSIARNKYRTHQLLERFQLPTPRAVIFRGDAAIEEAGKAIKDLRKPLVVKPLRGSLGKGVSVNVNSMREVADAIRVARKYRENVVIEEFVGGTDYRVFVFGNEVIDVIERVPAYVIGDGRSSIRKLIDAKNEQRVGLGLKPIRYDREVKQFLKRGGLALTSVPEAGKKVFLRLTCNMAVGGETRRIDIRRSVHPDNLAMFVTAAREIGLVLAGIDFITPDIAKSYLDTRCAINEINRAPMLDAHYFADLAMNNLVAEKVLARLQRARR